MPEGVGEVEVSLSLMEGTLGADYTVAVATPTGVGEAEGKWEQEKSRPIFVVCSYV